MYIIYRINALHNTFSSELCRIEVTVNGPVAISIMILKYFPWQHVLIMLIEYIFAKYMCWCMHAEQYMIQATPKYLNSSLVIRLSI